MNRLIASLCVLSLFFALQVEAEQGQKTVVLDKVTPNIYIYDANEEPTIIDCTCKIVENKYVTEILCNTCSDKKTRVYKIPDISRHAPDIKIWFN